MNRPHKKLCVVAVSFLALIAVLTMQGCTASSNTPADPDPPGGDTTAPTAPSNLQAMASTSTQVELSWAASTDHVGVTGYRIEQCSGAGCSSFTQIGTTSTTTYNASGLTASTSYSFRVRANDAAGNLSGYSNVASATTPAGASIAVSVSPTATTLTTGTAQSFTAGVQNDSQNRGVTWSLSGAGCSGTACGTLSGATSTTVTYTAPGTLPSPAAVILTATSVTDSTKNATATITLTANPVVSVSISPGGTSVQAGIGTAAFTASVSNDSQNRGVTWSLAGAGCSGSSCGTLSGATTTTVTYNAPASAPSPATVTLIATSVADTSKTASAIITVTAPVSVSVAPSSASLNISTTQQFNATVQNDSQNLGVTWSANGVAGGNATVGTISTTGLYTAPASVPGAGVTVTATSKADTNRSGSATVTVLGAVSVNVSPSTTSVQVNQSQSFTASVSNDPGNQGVTWLLSGTGCSGTTCGTLSNVTTASVTYTAPASVPSPAGVTLTATSKRDGSKSAAATITLTSAATIAVTVSPTSMSVTTGATQNFTATVQNDSQNKGVSWSLSGAGCSGTACGTLTNVTTAGVTYNAPATAPSPATVGLTGTSIADGTKTAAATITITTGSTNISVTVSPKRGGLTTSQTLSITATLTNDSANQGVNWSFTSSGPTSGGGISPASSTSGNAVTFTAPSAAGVVTITATAVGDNTKTATATIGVTDLTGVTTYHNNLSRDGTNQQEYALTTANVSTSAFGKLFSCAVDGAVYAQPLWVANVTVNGTKRNVLIVATMHDSVYAFDADTSPCVTLWHANLLDSAHGGTAGEVPAPSYVAGSVLGGGFGDISPEVGVTGTPVIDLDTKTVYAVAKSENTTTLQFFQRLHVLDLTTGAEKFGGPAQIDSSITVPGTGSGSSGGVVPFDPRYHNQRPGLALVNGVVYVSWASHEDAPPYHGWVLGFNASTLALSKSFNASPNGEQAGIWMSGGAPAADSSNNLYVMTGNGSFDANTGGSDYGSSYIKLSTSSGLTVSDYFAPHDQDSLSSSDQDVGAGGTALLFGQNLLVGAGKSGVFYVLNRSNMGHFNASSDAAAVQTWTASRAFSTPGFWNNAMYYFGVTFGSKQSGVVYAFNTGTGLFNTAPVSQTSTTFGFPGATPSISSSTSSNGIVWVIDSNAYCTPKSNNQPSACGPAVLHAYDALNLATELWNSSQNSGDAAGNAVKFTVPTVANGKVYIGTRGNNAGGVDSSTSTPGEIDVYGLLPN